MKRLLTIMAILCLLTGCFGAARAEIEITERENGYTAVSMKDDRTTIYGDGMIKMIDWGITL